MRCTPVIAPSIPFRWPLKKAKLFAMLPPPRQRGATVLVNGSARELRVQGNPTWRTVVKVDGVVVYDKFPAFDGKNDIKFDLIPGKPANLRWYKTTAGPLEYRVTVEGATTNLLPLESAAVTNARRVFQLRAGGVFLFAVSALSFYTNRQSLLKSGDYYPKALAIIPLLVFAGIVNLFDPSILHPALNKSTNHKITQRIVGVCGVVLLLFGFTLFSDWFLATFSKQ